MFVQIRKSHAVKINPQGTKDVNENDPQAELKDNHSRKKPSNDTLQAPAIGKETNSTPIVITKPEPHNYTNVQNKKRPCFAA